jgi:hypothetical protein
MVRVGDWKLTYQPLTDGATYRLFNIREDPGCRRNVIDQNPQTAATLRSLLDDWMDEDPKSGRRAYGAAASTRSVEQHDGAGLATATGGLWGAGSP